MSDSKKFDVWALVISALSFLMSGISLVYSVRQVGITAGQVKAYVQVTEVKLVEPLTDASFVTLQVKVKNFGQTAAIDVQGNMDYRDYSPDSQGDGNYATLRSFGPMGPGFERTVTLSSNRISRREWPAPSYRGDHYVSFYGTVWYTDDTSREDRKEDWCYVLVIKTSDDLKKTELEPCDIIKYTSKRDLRKDR